MLRCMKRTDFLKARVRAGCASESLLRPEEIRWQSGLQSYLQATSDIARWAWLREPQLCMSPVC